MQKKKNNSLLFTGIAILGIFILWIGYLIMNKKDGALPSTNSWTWKIVVKIIGDKRCNGCLTNEIGAKIKEAPFLANAQFVEQDFSDSGVEKYMKENELKFLPAFIFSTNEIVDDTGIRDFLVPLKDGNFILEVGSKFDPFTKRSEKGFAVIEKEKLDTLKKWSYVDGNETAKITWIEYSDVECPYCAKLHNSGVIEGLWKRYGSNLNRVFQHFPIIQAHKNALPAAQLLECAWEIWWAKSFYELSKNVYAGEKSDKKFILEEATKLGLDTGKLEVCFDDEKYKEKVLKQQKLWSELFWVNSTPTNVLVNNETGEYEILNGAMPQDKFEEVIEKLLK